VTSAAEVSTPIRRVVLGTCLLGVLASGIVVALAMTVWRDVTPAVPNEPWILLLAVALTAGGQLTYVRVRHGATYEELNFFEVALAVAILLLAPATALATTLTGMLVAEFVIRRGQWVKVAYNLGNYAVSSAMMIVTYRALLNVGEAVGGEEASTSLEARMAQVTSWWSMLSLVAASAVFTAVNLLLLAWLLGATTGASTREVLDEEWWLSALMAIGSVGIGFMAVALAFAAPAGLPFAFLPALALWYAYGASAQHAEARERNRWLVTLGGLLAQHGQGTAVLTQSAEAIRLIVGAPEACVLDPGDPNRKTDPRAERIVASVWSEPSPRTLSDAELPDGWRTGVVTRLDLGSAIPGALLLGSTEAYRASRVAGRSRGWSLDEADAPVLGALVAAVGSAMRAGAAFDALTEETAKLTAVVDNTSDGIAVIDEAGGVRLWSRTMANMTGVPLEALPPDPADAPPIVRALIDAALAAGEGDAPAHVHLHRSDGEDVEVSLVTVRVREKTAAASGGGGWVRILTAHDETRERRVERSQSDFIANVSHELKTPITPIKGYAVLLASSRGEGLSRERRAEALRAISHSADHLTRLVDELLVASQLREHARLQIVMEVADIGEVVSEAAANFPSMADRVVLHLPDAPLLVECDRFRAVQCLNNLLSNAEKYAPGEAPVEISVREVGRRVAIHVRDHGVGIPVSEQERVFDRFYRREDPFTTHTNGAGLGLHIARELAVAMGGALTLRSPAAGTGAEFVLELPRAGARHRPADPQPPPASHDEAHHGRPGWDGDGTMVPIEGRITTS
jgi:signal transduction histidine kinase